MKQKGLKEIYRQATKTLTLACQACEEARQRYKSARRKRQVALLAYKKALIKGQEKWRCKNG